MRGALEATHSSPRICCLGRSVGDGFRALCLYGIQPAEGWRWFRRRAPERWGQGESEVSVGLGVSGEQARSPEWRCTGHLVHWRESDPDRRERVKRAPMAERDATGDAQRVSLAKICGTTPHILHVIERTNSSTSMFGQRGSVFPCKGSPATPFPI